MNNNGNIPDIDGVSSVDDVESVNGDQSFIDLGDHAVYSESSADESDGKSVVMEQEQEPEDVDVPGEPDIPNAAVFGRGVEIGDEAIVKPLSEAEIALVRLQLRENLVTRREHDRAQVKKIGRFGYEVDKSTEEFRVPKDHPVFDGDVSKLEAFIESMELTHSKYTTGLARDKPNAEFISKLLPYFKEGSPAHTWFRVYARKRTQAGLKLTWCRLVRDIRASYGVFDQPDMQFEAYYTMMQKGDDIHTYIAKKCEASMMCNDLTPNLLKFGFIRGLDPDVKKHVKLAKPKTVEEAQREAIEYENSTGGKPTKKSSSSRSSTNSNSGRGRGHGNGNGRGDGTGGYGRGNGSGSSSTSSGGRKRGRGGDDNLSAEQSEALEALRQFRRNKCFGCGKEGHRREKCDATDVELAAFQEKVDKLKSKINRK